MKILTPEIRRMMKKFNLTYEEALIVYKLTKEVKNDNTDSKRNKRNPKKP